MQMAKSHQEYYIHGHGYAARLHIHSIAVQLRVSPLTFYITSIYRTNLSESFNFFSSLQFQQLPLDLNLYRD